MLENPIATPLLLSQFVRSAIADVERLAALDNFRLRLSVFFNRMYDSKKKTEVCEVCFAGACLIGIHQRERASSDMPTESDYEKMRRRLNNVEDALNEIRLGCLRRAAMDYYGFGITYNDTFQNLKDLDIEWQGRITKLQMPRFLADMRAAAKALEDWELASDIKPKIVTLKGTVRELLCQSPDQ